VFDFLPHYLFLPRIFKVSATHAIAP